MSDRKPNILFLFPDQQRADWLGFNRELDIATPVLENLARRGVRFTNAVTPSPLCAPARACLASGLSYDRCGVPDNSVDYPLDQPTYYQALRDKGYRVAGVGKFDLHKDTTDPANLDWYLDGSRLLADWGFTDGIDNEGKMDGSSSYRTTGGPKGPYLKFLADRGFADAYVEEHARQREVLGAYTTALPDDAYCDNWLTENGKKILEGFPAGNPWHLVVNFTGPHNPMDVTEGMRETVAERQYPEPIGNTKHDKIDLLRNRQNYAAMIENIDRLCGELIEIVENRGELDNTIIIYSADHGEMLGDFDRFGKNTWRYGSAHVPLIIAGPGIGKGVVTDALTDLTDITATILDYTESTPLPNMTGCSLRDLLEGRSDSHREVVRSGLGEWEMIYDGRYKRVDGDGESPLLFDRADDPHEQRNIASDHPDIAARLRSLGGQ